MLTHGSDRARRVGERVILHSAIPKGWTPRTPKTLTNAEHPGTTVLWDDEYFEVVEASATPSGGVTYMLMPWREEHTIRTLEQYDADSEALRIADHARAAKQRRSRVGAIFSGVFLGFLPAPVQTHLENELGVRATRMTLLSCIPPVVLLGACALAAVNARMNHTPAPFPFFVWPIVQLLTFESVIRFLVVMSQNRPMGSFFGVLGYAIYRALSPKRTQLPPMTSRGESVAFVEPTTDVALRDSFNVKEPLLTLLAPAEQKLLTDRFGFDHRRTGFAVAWVILVAAALGAATSYIELSQSGSFTSLLSMLIAAGVALEQALRLSKLRREPVGSIFGAIVRPLVRNLLR
jgi:hypothetical protein